MLLPHIYPFANLATPGPPGPSSYPSSPECVEGVFSEVQRQAIGPGSCGAPPLTVLHLKGNRKLGFCFNGSAARNYGAVFCCGGDLETGKAGLGVGPRDNLGER